MAYIEQEEVVFKPVKLVLETPEEVALLSSIFESFYENHPNSILTPKAKDFADIIGQYVPF